MATKTVTPIPTEITVSYSVGVKADALGQYENVNAMLSRTEKYDTTGMAREEIDAFWNERYDVLQAELGELIAEKYAQMHKGEI